MVGGEGEGARTSPLPPSSLCRDCELVAFLILGLVLPNFRLMTDALISSTVAVGRSDATLIWILRSLRSRSARRKVQLQLTVNTINVSIHLPSSESESESLCSPLSLGSSGNWLMVAASSGRMLYPSSST